ncbi:hypothetical protein LC087_17680 [Bacillus carboniphilus]|uniref:Transposase n=1 Tax=Bacillus carboniphilus TaxID=86663 RepID=A0ABY9JUT8_9BACI|nr:hypothetical protein [Bacillus carboniphilus]WLR42503.1 hypothetical protein LC087_17680 [Bacillus carboniphilus]
MLIEDLDQLIEETKELKSEFKKLEYLENQNKLLKEQMMELVKFLANEHKNEQQTKEKA